MDHVGWLSLGPRSHINNFYRESGSENRRLPRVSLVVVTPFSCFSYKDYHEFRLKHCVVFFKNDFIKICYYFIRNNTHFNNLALLATR